MIRTEEVKGSVDLWLQKYDNGEWVPSVSMGGLGLDYETAIQKLMIRMIRHLNLLEYFPEKSEHIEELEAALKRIVFADMIYMEEDLALSGAQVKAAVNGAFVICRQGVPRAFDIAPAKRLIKITSGGTCGLDIEGDIG